MMRNILIIIFAAFSTVAYGQRLKFEDWKAEAEQNTSLLPKYGGLERTKKEKESDEEFKRKVMESFDTEKEASNHMIDLGFQYLYKGDLKTAMYRFNQAYLLDNANSNIYWGYGTIYMAFGKPDLSREQYEEGLRMDSENDKILIDYGTTYLAEFYDNYEINNIEKANESLDIAIEKLFAAYEINPKNPSSSYKLSICYLYKDDCMKSKEYLKISEELGNSNITEAYKIELEEKCQSKDLNCSSIKTGRFKIEDERVGNTFIERTKKFQIEENPKTGYKIKLKVTWIDECTYQLKPLEYLQNPNNEDLPTMILTCTITELTENGYVQISSSDTDAFRVKRELIRVE